MRGTTCRPGSLDDSRALFPGGLCLHPYPGPRPEVMSPGGCPPTPASAALVEEVSVTSRAGWTRIFMVPPITAAPITAGPPSSRRVPRETAEKPGPGPDLLSLRPHQAQKRRGNHTDLGSPQPRPASDAKLGRHDLEVSSCLVSQGWALPQTQASSPHVHPAFFRAADNLAEFPRAWPPEANHLGLNLGFSTYPAV